MSLKVCDGCCVVPWCGTCAVVGTYVESCPLIDLTRLVPGVAAWTRVQGSAVLLPAWPCEWDVSFKLAAPAGAVVEGSLKQGKLSYTVEPESRASFITARACQQ